MAPHGDFIHTGKASSSGQSLFSEILSTFRASLPVELHSAYFLLGTCRGSQQKANCHLCVFVSVQGGVSGCEHVSSLCVSPEG